MSYYSRRWGRGGWYDPYYNTPIVIKSDDSSTQAAALQQQNQLLQQQLAHQQMMQQTRGREGRFPLMFIFLILFVIGLVFFMFMMMNKTR